jgi:cyclophilin family peptidyl-prolyl cis-trans isomerase
MKLMPAGVALVALVALAGLAAVVAHEAAAQAPTQFFTTPLAVDQMRGRQAVVETDLGSFVIDLLADAAPNHVGHFMKLADEGAYDGTVFHRLVRYGIIQGGDPLSKDPSQRDRYGTGGLGVLRAEFGDEPMTRGAVAAVLLPERPDSAGAQFFVCVVDQRALDGNYTVFGRVVEGMRVVEKISETPVDGNGRAAERVEIRSVTIRDTPPPEPVPFENETPAELASWQAVIETGMGAFTIDLLADKAPEHARNFLRLSSIGAYDGTAFHRVVRGFVIQTGLMSTREPPIAERQQKHVRTLQPEFNDTQHVKGTVSMARGDDPASASTSFFICTAPAPSLDGVYTAFGRVVEGIDVVEAIEAVPVDGESPVTRVGIVRVTLRQRQR